MSTSTIKTIMNKIKNKFALLVLILALSGCALSPGHIKTSSFNDENIIEINEDVVLMNKTYDQDFKVSTGDKLNIIVFGQEEFFPMNIGGARNPYIEKTVDENGKIFFPYAGEIKVSGKNLAEIRMLITEKLTSNFLNPQVDVSIAEFNLNRNIYILGEVYRPTTLSVGFVPISLSDAISEAGGFLSVSANTDMVFVIRKSRSNDSGKVYKATLESLNDFNISGEFRLLPGDIVYVGQAEITKWNRFISQLFPFASFINQIDNIEN